MKHKSLNELVMEFAAFCLLIVFIILLWKDNLLLFLAVFFESFVILFFWHDRYDLCSFLGIAAFGSITEVVFVGYGIWRYANPTFLGIPLWFPIAFGVSALVGYRLIRTIVKIL